MLDVYLTCLLRHDDAVVNALKMPFGDVLFL